MGQRNCGLARNVRDIPYKVGVGEIARVVLRDSLQRNVQVVHLTRLKGEEVEQMGVDEALEIGSEPQCGPLCEAGKPIDALARAKLDLVPKQHLTD